MWYLRIGVTLDRDRVKGGVKRYCIFHYLKVIFHIWRSSKANYEWDLLYLTANTHC